MEEKKADSQLTLREINEKFVKRPEPERPVGAKAKYIAAVRKAILEDRGNRQEAAPLPRRTLNFLNFLRRLMRK